MSTKTNTGLAAYCEAQLGLPYWWGGFGRIATPERLAASAKQYPEQYSAARQATAKAKHMGKRVHDCVGLIKAYRWRETLTADPVYVSAQDVNVSGMLKLCSRRGTITTIPEIPGVLVFRKLEHIGVYVGGGLVIEAKGFDFGVVKTKLSAGGWDTWGMADWITYPASAFGTTATAPAAPPSPASATLKAGTVIRLSDAPLYTSSTDKAGAGKRSGTFYLYDGQVVNGRLRITNTAANIGKTPVESYVTGWIDAKEVWSESTQRKKIKYIICQEILLQMRYLLMSRSRLFHDLIALL
ncbi:MAG: hypothetical protein FWF05_01995 [Oscillospiraceae bacterium]|nr:hypothetical protein [Oscillospiraceae bacterium]